jgi:ABC-type antimicrobial peptide transport system permease subunit
MRSALTCIGIIIGIAAVIALLEIGSGATKAIQAAISSFGANLVIIFPGESTSNGISFGAGSMVTLTPQDCDAIKDECPAVRSAAPHVGARFQLVVGHKNWQPSDIHGTTPAYLDVGNWKVADGAPFTDHDVQTGNLVCLIGKTLERELFDGEPALGQYVRAQNTNLRVVGVLASKGANMTGNDQDDILVLPWTTLKYRLSNSSLGKTNQSAASGLASTINTLSNLFPSSGVAVYPAVSAAQAADTPLPVRFSNIDAVFTSVSSPGEIPGAILEITQVLRERHRLTPGQPDDFHILNVTEFTNALTSATGMMTNLLAAVALISLIVGGVGIMNIMLVSVTERTREIGLRMAVGARGNDILRQFLIEAVVLCLLGGIIGILFGRGCSMLVQLALKWPIAMSIPAIVAALVVSGSIGVAFGFYPAWKASRMNPIDALRFE